MNPNKLILKYLYQAQSDGLKTQEPTTIGKLQEIFDGMSSGTAKIIIDQEASERFSKQYTVEGMKNKGLYYIAKIVNQNGRLIRELLLDKQTGEVKFV